MKKENFFYWILSFILACGIFATEVFNCHWNFDGTEYTCDKIGEDEKPVVEEPLPSIDEDFDLEFRGNQWDH